MPQSAVTKLVPKVPHLNRSIQDEQDESQLLLSQEMKRSVSGSASAAEVSSHSLGALRASQ